jgi:hypothetical protein
MNLGSTASALADQFPSGSPDEFAVQDRRTRLFGLIAVGSVVLVVGASLLALIYTIVTRMILTGREPVTGVLSILMIISLILVLAYVVYLVDLKMKRRQREFALRSSSPTESVTSKLVNESADSSVASIVEDTTDLLAVENKTRKI